MTAAVSFTSRVFGTFVQEGLRMLAEGIHPARIEMELLKAGMPVGPLAIQDEVSLTLSEHVANETRKALQARRQRFAALRRRRSHSNHDS